MRCEHVISEKEKQIRLTGGRVFGICARCGRFTDFSEQREFTLRESAGKQTKCK
jgi:hypothetical protein